ncbi:hypothetical protein BHYA_0035g00400 [Botrytis hyacinthi]|uniref:Uncharacterized protein n=1 Tax=Botrytis hyacinthi TaxID=278943 RepID=A0A4Z1GUI4_9HELO|nr:hypothetical protein BHYA_0035g00400 [Botrytis hyacinthi]
MQRTRSRICSTTAASKHLRDTESSPECIEREGGTGRSHREAIILERRRRDVARENYSALLESLGREREESTLLRGDLLEARNRADYLNHGINLLKMRMSDQRDWSDELEMHAMQGEVFNRMGGTWDPSVYKRRIEEYEDREMGERAAKRACGY